MTDKEIRIRNAEPSDHSRIISVMPNWWGGRDLTAMLPDFFLAHFSDTCFVVEKEQDLIGFLVGFLSQSRLDEAYIHFVGVHPDFRKEGLGAALYEKFFQICRERNRSVVRARTALVNIGSFNFHTRMGFLSEQTDTKFLFTKRLDG